MTPGKNAAASAVGSDAFPFRPDTARGSDLPVLKRLWMECFGDSEDYVNLYFDHGFDPAQGFVLRDTAGLPAAMAIWFPVQYLAEDGDEQTGAYLYAVCTDPAQRGRGCFRALMRHAEQTLAGKGCDFVCLKPGDAALAATYAQMGYQAGFFSRCRTVAADSSCYVNLTPLDAPRYGQLRQLRLRGSFIDYPVQTLAHQARLGPLYALSAGELFGLCAAERTGSGETAQVLVKEYLGDEALLPGLCAALGAARIAVRMPPDGGVDDVPFAMAKPLSGQPCPTGYLGLAFD